MQILLVDDDAAMLKVLGRLLCSEGHEVDACTNGAEALARLQQKSYALLVTDLTMRSMSGLELVRAANELSAGLSCVILTGQPPPDDEAGRGGAQWLSKPLDFSALLALIDAHPARLP